MRRPVLFAALLAFAALPAFGQSAPGEPHISPEGVRAHVEFLADDLLEGRNAGTRGHEIAARYVASRFDAMGLKPGGTDGGWYQQVPLTEYSLDTKIPPAVSIGNATFANGREVIVGPATRPDLAQQSLDSDVVFVGYGIDDKKLGRDDYRGADVRGKLVAMLTGTPPGIPADQVSAVTEGKPAAAVAHGATGVIAIMTPETLQRYPWATIAGYVQRPGTGLAEQEDQPGITVYATGTAAEALFAGSPKTLAQVLADAAKPGARPRAFALRQRVAITRASQVHTVNSPNVLGILPGSDPALANEYVLVMAHLDHIGVDPALKGDQIFNGAMDNAAGTATMLEAARAFVESGHKPKRPILFAAVTAEEDGLLGSQWLASHPLPAGGKVVAVVNLDMPILLYDFTDIVAFGAEHSTMGPTVAAAAAKMGVKLSPDPMPEENLFMRSDHFSFVQAGVPSVFLVTGFANGGEKAFRDFLANHYHKVSDQLDLPFDWKAGAKFATLNYRIAAEIADAPQAPRWYAGDAFGEMYAPNAPTAPAPAEAAPEKGRK